MDKQIENIVLRATGAKSIEDEYKIQSLWSGYGSIVRVELSGVSLNSDACHSVVVKHVNFPRGMKKGDLSHERKVKSYKVETNWYKNWSDRCDDYCRVPKRLALKSFDDDVVIVMKDIAYFTGSCFSDSECGDVEQSVLDVYFKYLREAIIRKDRRKKKDVDIKKLEENWRELYRVAWTDFHRFLKGWSAGRWNDSSYSERVAAEVLGKI